MTKRVRPAFLPAMVSALVTMGCSPTEPNRLDELATVRMKIGEQWFELWVADTWEKQEKGMMFIKEEQMDFLGPYLNAGDHAPFWDQGFPGIQIGNTGPDRNPYYHCMNGQDAPETLDYTFLANVTRATVGAIADTLGMNESK